MFIVYWKLNFHPALKIPGLTGHQNPQVSLVLLFLVIDVWVRVGARVWCPFDVFVCVRVSPHLSPSSVNTK